jgi:hypothetical protein
MIEITYNVYDLRYAKRIHQNGNGQEKSHRMNARSTIQRLAGLTRLANPFSRHSGFPHLIHRLFNASATVPYHQGIVLPVLSVDASCTFPV